jgi:hypothetical protein
VEGKREEGRGKREEEVEGKREEGRGGGGLRSAHPSQLVQEASLEKTF